MIYLLHLQLLAYFVQCNIQYTLWGEKEKMVNHNVESYGQIQCKSHGAPSSLNSSVNMFIIKLPVREYIMRKMV